MSALRELATDTMDERFPASRAAGNKKEERSGVPKVLDWEMVELPVPGRDVSFLLGLRSGKVNEERLVGVGYRCAGANGLSSFIMVVGISEVCCAENEVPRGDGTVEENEARELRCSPVRPTETVMAYDDMTEFLAEG